jgi:mono/diheme cytochrome c family protein
VLNRSHDARGKPLSSCMDAGTHHGKPVAITHQWLTLVRMMTRRAGVLRVSDGCRRSMMNRDTHLPFLTALAIAIVWIILAVFLHAQDAQFHDAPPSSAQLKNPYSRQQTAVSSGSRIYATNCSSCHGSHGEGNGAMPALAHGPTQSASEGELFWFITTGAPDKGMPSWSTLPERQRWQLVTYLKSLKNSHDAQEGASASK